MNLIKICINKSTGFKAKLVSSVKESLTMQFVPVLAPSIKLDVSGLESFESNDSNK